MTKTTDTSADAGKDDFSALLGELSGVAKSFGESTAKDDKKIEGAAADGADKSDKDDKKDGKDKDGKEAEVTKSFEITLESGEKIQAVDGVELFKALATRVETAETNLKTFATESLSLIKSLVDQVTKLSNAGTGRRAVLTIAEKKTVAEEPLNKSDKQEGMSGEDFMAKAMIAFGKGAISGTDVSALEINLQRGVQPDVSFVKKVMAAAS